MNGHAFTGNGTRAPACRHTRRAVLEVHGTIDHVSSNTIERPAGADRSALMVEAENEAPRAKCHRQCYTGSRAVAFPFAITAPRTTVGDVKVLATLCDVSSNCAQTVAKERCCMYHPGRDTAQRRTATRPSSVVSHRPTVADGPDAERGREPRSEAREMGSWRRRVRFMLLERCTEVAFSKVCTMSTSGVRIQTHGVGALLHRHPDPASTLFLRPSAHVGARPATSPCTPRYCSFM